MLLIIKCKIKVYKCYDLFSSCPSKKYFKVNSVVHTSFAEVLPVTNGLVYCQQNLLQTLRDLYILFVKPNIVFGNILFYALKKCIST